MMLNVGKIYYRVKDDGGIYQFLIDKCVREILHDDGVISGLMDTYQSSGSAVVKHIHNNLKSEESLKNIFDNKNDAIDFLINKLNSERVDDSSLLD